MVIHTERGPAEEQLVAGLRSIFDASVMNFGSYNLLYAENLLGERDHEAPAAQTQGDFSVQARLVRARDILVGYRREPVEMVLCPVVLSQALRPQIAKSAGCEELLDPVPTVPALVNLTNLAGLATEGSTVEIVLSTGRRLVLDVQEAPVLPHAEVRLQQGLDVQDFYDFLEHFMDVVERMSTVQDEP